MHLKLRIAIIALLSVFTLRTAAQTTSGNGTKSQPNHSASSPNPSPETMENRVEKYLRNLYAWGPAYEVKVGPPMPSPISDLLEVKVSVSMNGQGDSATVYVSKNGSFIIQGQLLDMSVDPFADNRSKLHPGNSPSIGSENAPITLIEFADFECPSCRQLDRILRDFLPNHPEVRLVFKHFPLTEIHPWAMTAAIASQCTFEQAPSAFWKIHDQIFDAQDGINLANVSDKMTDFAAKLGLNKDTFQSCISNPETTHQVEETMREGRALNLTATPTTFVNGRRVVGADESLLEQFVQIETPRN